MTTITTVAIYRPDPAFPIGDAPEPPMVEYMNRITAGRPGWHDGDASWTYQPGGYMSATLHALGDPAENGWLLHYSCPACHADQTDPIKDLFGAAPQRVAERARAAAEAVVDFHNHRGSPLRCVYLPGVRA